MSVLANPRRLAPRSAGGILFLDLATITGWAYGSSQDPSPVSGSCRFPNPSDGRAKTFDACYGLVSDLCEFYQPRIVVNEQALVTTVRRKGEFRNIVTNDDVITVLRGLIAVANLAAEHYDVPWLEYPAQTYRKVLHGMPETRKADGKKDWKATAVRWCLLHGYTPVDDNEADARVGLEFCLRMHESAGHVL